MRERSRGFCWGGGALSVSARGVGRLGGVSSGLQLWLRSDLNGAGATPGVTTDNASVMQWKNIGGTAQLDGLWGAPIWNDDAANLSSFNPTIRFDGSTFIRFPSDFALGNTLDFTFAAGYELATSAAGGHALIGPSGDAAAMTVEIFNGAPYNVQVHRWSQPLFTAAVPSSAGRPTMLSTGRSTAGDAQMRIEGKTASTGNGDPVAFWTSGYYFGATHLHGALTGNVADGVLYDRQLTVEELNRVESYTAVRTGVTLDQTTPQSYTASDGSSLMWDSGVLNAATYDNAVTVIGRDDGSALDQRQSISEMPSGMVAVSNGAVFAASNPQNSTVFGADKTFLSFGDDDAAIVTWTGTESPLYTQRVAREWRVQQHGAVGPVTVRVPASTSTLANKLPWTTEPMYMLVDGDG